MEISKKSAEVTARKISETNPWLVAAVILLLFIAISLVYLLFFQYQYPDQVIRPKYSVNSFDNLLAQQQNIISWFSLFATLIVAIMASITAWGYFSTKNVNKQMKIFEDAESKMKKFREEVNTELLNAQDRAKSAARLWDEFNNGLDNATRYPLRIAFETPSKKQRKEIRVLGEAVSALRNTHKEISGKQSLIEALKLFYAEELEESLDLLEREIDEYDLTTSEGTMAIYLKALIKKRCHMLYGLDALSVILSEQSFVAAYILYYDSIHRHLEIGQTGNTAEYVGYVRSAIKERLKLDSGSIGIELNNGKLENAAFILSILFLENDLRDPKAESDLVEQAFKNMPSSQVALFVQREIKMKLNFDDWQYDINDETKKGIWLEKAKDLFKSEGLNPCHLSLTDPAYQELKKEISMKNFFGQVNIQYGPPLKQLTHA